ncbi:hypothetical protein [Roseateles sp.]|jgi:Na+-driven multidrug efflux pump|uniref:hypothetical protein n=1 Tax=Roseateles sp. TaxID=1971397 RepID=UPI00391C5AAD
MSHTMTPRRFRQLLSLAILLAIASVCVDLLFPQLLPSAFRDLMEQQDAAQPDGLVMAMGLVCLAFLPVGIWATIGLFRFRAAGRRWSLILSIVALPLALLMGPLTLSGLALVLTELSAMLWGGTLALAYYHAELAGRFNTGSPRPGRD